LEFWKAALAKANLAFGTVLHVVCSTNQVSGLLIGMHHPGVLKLDLAFKTTSAEKDSTANITGTTTMFPMMFLQFAMQ
jgi:hypothetical protein